MSTAPGSNAREHGGTDPGPPVVWDFSTNANACGPAPQALARVRAAAHGRYPDPAYTELRAALARWHGVEPERIVVAASASEAIMRLSAWCARQGWRRVWLPRHGYGEYRHAAHVWGLCTVDEPAQAHLAWLCEPSSPLGQDESPETVMQVLARPCPVVVADLAYAPLRLQGRAVLGDGARRHLWQLWSPNKALGLTGVRAAYLVAPAHVAQDALAALQALAPSWPLGADGVALLHAWVQPDVQRWLQATLPTLAQWRRALVEGLRHRGWQVLDSVAPFVCARPPRPPEVGRLRAAGVKLRDATSFGLPGWWRLSAQPPQALEALWQALDEDVRPHVAPHRPRREGDVPAAEVSR
ncbi:MAG: aminotransferase class I/II-fold pyridoxal phosphate-dependent enzyme [Tepidimonas ignava]